MNRKERRTRQKALKKQLKKGNFKNPFPEPELNALAEAIVGPDVNEIMSKEQEELLSKREKDELVDTISKFADALTLDREGEELSITIDCIEKGPIVLELAQNKKDPRCSNPDCITCRTYDAETGVVDRHLLTEKQKHERDMEALERQKQEDPEGYAAFLASQKKEEGITDVDFEEIKESKGSDYDIDNEFPDFPNLENYD